MSDNYQHGYDEMGYHNPYNQEQVYQKPLDPAVERIRRKLMRLMIISVSITMLLIVAVLITVIYKAMTPATPVEQPIAKIEEDVVVPKPEAEIKLEIIEPQVVDRNLTLPTGTRILSQSLSGDLILLETLNPEGKTKLVVYDYRSGNLVANVTLDTQKAPTQASTIAQ